MMKKSLQFSIVGCLIAVLPAFSQVDTTKTTKELEEVIIKGNRMDTPFSKVSRDIQILTHKEIEALPVKSLNEALAYVSGVDIRQRGPFGTQTDIALDGGTSEQTIILINGVKMLDAQTAHNMMNIPIPLSAIERIEVIRGAAARIYGINSLTGAINIVTKKEQTSSVVAQIQAGSSFKKKDEGDGDGIYGGGGVEVTGLFGTQKQSHLLSIGQSNYNGQRYNTASTTTRAFYNGNFNFTENHSIQASAGHARSLFGANGFYAAPGDLNSEELVNSTLVSLSSKHRWGKFTLTPRISNRYGEDDYRYFKDNLDIARSLHYTNALMAELNSELRTKIGVFGFGLESRFEQINSTNIGQHKRDNHGAYAEFSRGFGSWFLGTVGAYANYNTDYGIQVYPGLDMAFFLPYNVKLSANIGTGQRIPSFTDLYLNQAPGNVGNPTVQPENAWSYELSAEYRHKGLTVKGGYFYRDISNFIDWTRPSDTVPYTPYNLGNNLVHGVYARVSQRIKIGENHDFTYILSYNYLSPSMKSTSEHQSKYVLESLKHQLIAGVNYRYKGLSVQVQNRLIKRELAAAYDLLDLRVSYDMSDFTIYTEVSNLLNAEYREAGAVPMPSRWFSLGLRYHWKEKAKKMVGEGVNQL